jgi:hypothetical protein
MSPEASLRAWIPAIHAGMTKNLHFSFFVAERKIRNHLWQIVNPGFPSTEGGQEKIITDH